MPLMEQVDVTALVDLGLLERAADGQLSAPSGEIVIHAEVPPRLERR